MSPEFEVLHTFPNIKIVAINEPVKKGSWRARYEDELICIHLSNGQFISFHAITDCCASVSLRTDVDEFKELIGKKLSSLVFIKSEDVESGGYGEYITYSYYKFIFSDNTEFEFDFDGDHGNGGYYAAEVTVYISDVNGKELEEEE